MTTSSTEAIIRSYHRGWTRGQIEQSAALLAEDLQVEVPINAYDGAASFIEAVRGFAGATRRVELLAELFGEGEAMLLYDMEVEGLGPLRVAEHFTVSAGRIVRIRQIHDTAALRAAGFARES